MRYHFTKHSKEKFRRMRASGFPITERKVTATIANPVKVEPRNDGTMIASSLLDDLHILRVVYRVDGDIMIIITFYPGRRKAYAV